MSEVTRLLDFIYGYMVFKAYFFGLKTKVFDTYYPNEEYAERWRRYLKSFSDELLDEAFKIIKRCKSVPDGLFELYDCFDRSSYFALIHPNHPNITLGFVKDADLWDIWLKCGIYEVVRNKILDVAGISKDLRVLDMGCGSVSPSFYGENVKRYTGIDFSRPLLNLAKVRVKEKGLSDRVNLREGYADAKLFFKNMYDVVIMSSVIQYLDVKSALHNALRALGGEGRIVVFTEVLSEDRMELFDLYYSLIPSFKGFPSLNRLKEILDTTCDYRIRMVDGIIIIDVMDSYYRAVRGRV